MNSATGGGGTIVVNGAAMDYTVDGAQAQLLILVKRKSLPQCSVFHHHAVASLATQYTFALDKDAPSSSNLRAEVFVSGLDPDQDAYRDAFPETAGSRLTDSDRADIRVSVAEQVDARNHPTMKFNATQITTLDGAGTADVEVSLRGAVSHLTMNVTARWEGTSLIIDGTGTLDGAAHGMPVGSFKDCIEAPMTLKMHLVLIPGKGTTDL